MIEMYNHFKRYGALISAPFNKNENLEYTNIKEYDTKIDFTEQILNEQD